MHSCLFHPLDLVIFYESNKLPYQNASCSVPGLPMGGASLPVGTAWCHNGVRYPLPRLVGRTRPPILFSASDSRYSHYPLHERRYPYRQSAHLRVLSCVTACRSHQAGLAGNSVRSALRFVQHVLFVLRHADYEIRAGYAETGFPWPPYPLGFINQYASFPSGIRRLSSPQPCLWHFGSETVLFPFSSRQ